MHRFANRCAIQWQFWPGLMPQCLAPGCIGMAHASDGGTLSDAPDACCTTRRCQEIENFR